MPTVHIIQPGEHLSAIAVRHGFDGYRDLDNHIHAEMPDDFPDPAPPKPPPAPAP